MEILKFGDINKRKIILIHGFQSPYTIWDPYIERYQNDFHILVPILPGHNPKQPEDFVSFSETVKEMEDHVLSYYGEDVYAVYGMSMGGVFAAALWQNRRLNIRKVIFDGSPLVSVNGMMRRMMLRFYLKATHNVQKRDQKTLNQAIGSMIPKERLNDFIQVLDHMSDSTITNYINSIYDFRLQDNIDAQNTEIYFYHGTAVNEIIARKSAKFISKHYPGAVIRCLKGKSHCETALFQPDVMIKELDKVLR